MWVDFMEKVKQASNRLGLLLGEDVNVQSDVKQQKMAKKTLQLDAPILSNILPYESIDDDLVFFNKNSIGFGLQLLPATGADETLVKSMAELIQNKLPQGVD